MIYPSNFEQKIGFDRLREQVVALCSMQAAREIIRGEKFTSSRECGHLHPLLQAREVPPRV